MEDVEVVDGIQHVGNLDPNTALHLVVRKAPETREEVREPVQDEERQEVEHERREQIWDPVHKQGKRKQHA